MNEKLWELLRQYIQAKIEEEIAFIQLDADGYRDTPWKERKRVENIEREINNLIDKKE